MLQRLVAAVDDEASHDPLTGLLNRRGMALRFPSVRAAAPDGHAVAAVVLDLDRFKRIKRRPRARRRRPRARAG
ncbi:MAG: diguanylate cyclase, partial [Quadrisphaera sp.]